ncbi:fungal-specific transcription factor domain-containing protein [Xylogone sp. PMI_703]|nr:fungal-specific transcription factor domain-containing protein [Xylogone sp. PMI_703]
MTTEISFSFTLLYCVGHGSMFGNIQSQTDVSRQTPSGRLRDPMSKISCSSCRKRKVRCTKERPACLVCVSTSQTCSYPTLLRKRGPKIGSRHSKLRNKGDLQRSHRNDPNKDAGRRSWSNNVHLSDDVMPEPENVVSAAASLPSSRAKDDILALSYILHPTLENLFPECQQQQASEKTPAEVMMGSIFDSTCWHLGLTPELLLRLISEYFKSFTSFRLFRKSDFYVTMQKMESETQRTALLAAMLAFAVRTLDMETAAELNAANTCSLEDNSGSYFINQAISALDEAIQECGDSPVPLSLLQALILVTHWLLIRNARGRSCRYLGTCVSIAYELNLHLVDAEDEVSEPDSSSWCADEERRRAWWAVWEMDVFASIVRRCPTIIDWSQMKTCLPAQDDRWFQGQPQRSCLFYPSVADRISALKLSGNESPVSWYIVINSLVKEAQDISSPPRLPRRAISTEGWKFSLPGGSQDKDGYRLLDRTSHAEASQKLSMITNALKCFTMGLPRPLRYHGQRLSFDGSLSDPTEGMNLRHFHSALYSIHMMTQLARFMICKYYIFHGNNHTDPLVIERKHLLRMLDPENDNTDQYFQAARNVTVLIQRSSEDHLRFVNPCFANTLWLAAAVQLLRREATVADSMARDQINSDFQLLRFSCDQFVEYWGISNVLDANLATLERRLLSFRRPCHPPRREDTIVQPVNRDKHLVPNEGTAGQTTNNGAVPPWILRPQYVATNTLEEGGYPFTQVSMPNTARPMKANQHEQSPLESSATYLRPLPNERSLDATYNETDATDGIPSCELTLLVPSSSLQQGKNCASTDSPIWTVQADKGALLNTGHASETDLNLQFNGHEYSLENFDNLLWQLYG